MQTLTFDRSQLLEDAASRENSRLAALYAYGVLDSASDARIDELTRATAEVFGVPVASVSLLDRDRLWAKSLVGTDIRQVPRTEGFSSRLLDMEGTTLVIPDATLDAGFRDLKLVKGPEAFRFYAGAKLLDADGHMLGVLCALDRRPGSATPAQLRRLERLAAAVVTALELTRSQTALQRSSVQDTVTGLANRSSFEAALRDLLGQRVPGRCAVLAVDLGRFSRVTDLAGHAGGEDLLRQAADRLKAIAGLNDLVARLAGDEYAVLVPGSDGDEAKALGDEILDRSPSHSTSAACRFSSARRSASPAIPRMAPAPRTCCATWRTPLTGPSGAGATNRSVSMPGYTRNSSASG